MEFEQMAFIFAAIVLLIVALSIIKSGFFTVRTGERGAIERFGRFVRVAKPGLKFKIPLIERMNRVSVKAQQLGMEMETKTQDNVFVTIPVIIHYSIDPDRIEDAVYQIADPEEQMQAIVRPIILGHIPTMDLDDVFNSQPQIAAELKEKLSLAIERFGIVIQRAMITDIVPSEGVRAAMDKINIARRNAISAAAQGEADKITVVKEAEAEAEAKALQGKGVADERVAIARGIKEASELIQKATGVDGEEAALIMLTTNYIDMLTRVGESDNSTTIFMPSGPGGLNTLMQEMSLALAGAKK